MKYRGDFKAVSEVEEAEIKAELLAMEDQMRKMHTVFQ